jgi:DNA-binding transcriptional MerR regulator
MPPPGFTVAEAARLCESSERQVRYLHKLDAVSPSIKQPTGRGSAALYAFAELVTLRVISRVREIAGADVRAARVSQIATALEGANEGPLGGKRLVIDSSGVWLEDATSLNDLLASEPAALIVNLEAIERELRRAINRAGQRQVDAAKAA